MLTIYYRNYCPSLVDHPTAQKWVAAWQKWIDFDVAPEWNVASVLHYIGDSLIEKPGPRDGVINIVRYSSVDGALGAHWLDGQQPIGEIGVQTCIDDGVEPSSCGGHETGEMTVDPPASEARQQGRLFLSKELCDRVEGSDPDYKIDGVVMENFSTQSAFDDGPGPWDFRRKCKSNIVLPNGYQLQLDAGTGEWQQVTGELARASKRSAGPSSRRAARMIRAGYDPKNLVLVAA